MALAHRRYQLPAALVAALGNPAIRQQLENLARQAGNGIGNAARNWYNNLGNDPDNNYEFNDEERMEPDSTSAVESQINAPPLQNKTAMTQGASGSLGKYRGNTSTKIGWEKYYFERDVFHSRKIHTKDLLWGFSSFPILDVNGKFIRLSKWSNCYGVVYRPIPITNDPALLNIFYDFGPDSHCLTSMTDHCYSHAINFSVGDFFDNKVLSFKGGALRNFVKVTLVKFSVKIEIKTRNKSILELNNQIFNNIEKYSGADPVLSNYNNPRSEQQPRLNEKYWIYRDINGDYIDQTTLDIPYAPPDAKAGVTVDALPRTCHQIRAYDNNLCVCSDDEPFYFEREISPQGPYYITPQKLFDLRTSNMAVLVNTIEHQYGSSPIISSLPEYYNLLIVPCNVDWYQTSQYKVGGTDASPINGCVVLSNMSTQLAITCCATWKGFNYNHLGEMQVQTIHTKVTDPYDIAEMKFKAQQNLVSNSVDKNL